MKKFTQHARDQFFFLQKQKTVEIFTDTWSVFRTQNEQCVREQLTGVHNVATRSARLKKKKKHARIPSRSLLPEKGVPRPHDVCFNLKHTNI